MSKERRLHDDEERYRRKCPKRDGERDLRGGWMKVTKKDGGRIMRGCTGEDVTNGTVRVT